MLVNPALEKWRQVNSLSWLASEPRLLGEFQVIETPCLKNPR